MVKNISIFSKSQYFFSIGRDLTVGCLRPRGESKDIRAVLFNIVWGRGVTEKQLGLEGEGLSA